MVRRALEKDIARINELGKLLNKNFSKLFVMKKILTEEFSKIFVYVNEEDYVLAFLHVTEIYETVDIINIVVDPLHRREKIASILIDYMISDINKKVLLFTLEVNCNNEAAINLYKEFGFEIINTRKSYYEDGDAYLMAKEVEK